MSDDATEPRLYEFAVLYPTDLGQKEEQDLVKSIEEIFAEAGGKQVMKDVWGRRGLAFPVAGHTEGKFIIYYYEIDPSRVKEISQALKILKNLLRHLVLKPPKGYQITKWSERYEQWLKDRERQEEVREREKEERLQEQIARKARRQAERDAATRKKTEEPRPALAEGEITEQIEKLISDDQIDI